MMKINNCNYDGARFPRCEYLLCNYLLAAVGVLRQGVEFAIISVRLEMFESSFLQLSVREGSLLQYAESR